MRWFGEVKYSALALRVAGYRTVLTSPSGPNPEKLEIPLWRNNDVSMMCHDVAVSPENAVPPLSSQLLTVFVLFPRRTSLQMVPERYVRAFLVRTTADRRNLVAFSACFVASSCLSIFSHLWCLCDL